VPGIRTYVFSRTLSPATRKDVTVLRDTSVLAELRKENGKDIWLFGGGVLFGSALSQGLVDRVEVIIIPVLLGAAPSIAHRGGQVYGIDQASLENTNPGWNLVTGENHGCYANGEHSNQLG
jgi:dihydrofolate reductase